MFLVRLGLKCLLRLHILLQAFDCFLDLALVILGMLVRLLHVTFLITKGLVKRLHVADLAGDGLGALPLQGLVAFRCILNDTTVKTSMLQHVLEPLLATLAADVLIIF